MHNIIGHRGAITYAVENTLSSIYAVKVLNHNWIEADVMLTKDKIPIMFHDETLERLTYTTGNVNSYNYDELKNLELKNTKNKIPLLSDFVEKCDKLKINIMLELKTCHNEYQLVNKVVEIIKKIKNIIIIICSYSRRILSYLNLLYPNNNYIYIVDKIPDDWYEIVKIYKCAGISINYNCNSLNDIKLCNDKIPTYCFTINTKREYDKIKKINVEGIITDKPELFYPKISDR
jgi:glycerophosphoryl diester phosphodiesterase